MRAAIYARVSSAQQRDANTIASQLEQLPRYAEGQGWQVVARYVDDGISAKAGNLDARRGLTRALADAGEVYDVLVVWDVDRLTRSEDLTERGAILGALQRAGVKLAVLGKGVQPFDTIEGEVMLGLQAAFAAEWVRKHRARIKAGKLRAIARGGKPAGPTPYGYRYDRVTGWLADHDESAVLRDIFTRVARGESMASIADGLAASGTPRGKGGEWTGSWIWQLVRSREYYGTGQWAADKQRGSTVPVPVIIEPALWSAAQRVLDAHSKRGQRRTVRDYLLQGMAVCECGEAVHIHSAHDAERLPARYVCRQRLRPRRGTDPCEVSAYRFLIAEVDSAVWSRLLDWLESPRLMRSIASARRRAATGDAALWQEDADRAQRALDRLTRAESGLLARVRRGLVSDDAADRELGTIARERQGQARQLEAARRAVGSTAIAVKDADALETAAAGLRRAASVATTVQRRALVRGLLERPARLGREGEILLSVGLRPVSAAGYSSDMSTSVRDDLVLRVGA